MWTGTAGPEGKGWLWFENPGGGGALVKGAVTFEFIRALVVSFVALIPVLLIKLLSFNQEAD